MATKMPGEAQPMIVTGVPVSGLDGAPTQVVIRGTRVDLPTKFNQKSTKCTDVFWAILFWVTMVGFVTLLALDLSHEGPTRGAAKLVRLLETPDQSALLHLAGGVCFGALLVWSFVFSLKKMPGGVVWAGIILGAPVFLLTSVLCAFMATQMIDQVNHVSAPSGLPSSQMVQLILLVTGAIWSGTFGIFYLFWACFVCCCCRSTIQLTIALFQAAGVVLDKYKCSLGVALGCAVLSKGFIGIWLGGTMSIYTRVDTLARAHTNEPGTQFLAHAGAFFFCLITFFWFLNTASNVAHVTYCKLVAFWYFNNDREQRTGAKRMSTLSAWWSAMTIHFGSIAFGSFLISVIQAMQVMNEIAKNQVESGDNDVGKLVFLIIYCILSAVLSVLADIVEFFSKIAYCHVATYNTDFCTSVRSTMKLMLASGMKLVVNDNCASSVIWLWITLMIYPQVIFAYVTGASMVSARGVNAGQAIGNTVVFTLEIGLVFMFLVNAGSMLESAILQMFVCYAEHPDTLNVTHPEIAREFAKASYSYFDSLEEGGPDVMKPSNDVMANEGNYVNEGSALGHPGAQTYGGAPQFGQGVNQGVPVSQY